MIGSKQTYTAPLLLSSLIIFHVISNYFWLRADNSIPKHDENQYLAKSIRSFHLLAGPGSGKIARLFEVEPKIRPHLFPLTAIPFYLFRGISYDSACLSNILFMALVVLATYGLGKETGASARGLTAAFMISFYPFVLMFSRSFWSEIPLMAAFAGSLYLLLKTRTFRDRPYSAGLGLALAAGMLMQQRFIFFIITPFLITASRAVITLEKGADGPGKSGFRRRLRWSRPLSNILLCLIIAAALIVPYYLRYYRVFSTKFAYGITGGAWEPVPNTFSLGSLSWYLGQMYKEMSLFFFILFAGGMALTLFRFNKSHAFLLFSFLGGYLIITIFPSKDARYVSTLLPVAALITTNGFFLLRSRPLRIVIGALILATAFGNYLRVSWNTGPFKIPYHKARFNLPLIAEPLELVPPDKPPSPFSNWKWEEIIARIDRDREGRENKLLVVPYLPEFNSPTFSYFCLLNDIPLQCVDVGTQNLYHYNFKNLLDSDYIVTKTGKSVPFSHIRFEFARKTAEMLENPPAPFQKSHLTIATFQLPDDSEARLLKRQKPVTTAEEIAVIEESLKIDPSHPWAYLALGEAYLDSDQPGRALPNFRKVMELLPEWPGGYLGAGRVHLAQGKTEQALRLTKKGLALAPDFHYAHFLLGTVYEQTWEFQKAIKEYNIAIKGKPELAKKASERLQGINRKLKNRN